MTKHANISTTSLHEKIKAGEICFAGNNKLKIYGTLQGKSGNRMKKKPCLLYMRTGSI